MKKVDIRLILLLLLFPCLILSFQIHKSFILQASILSEINSNKFTDNTYNRLKSTNIKFPSVSVTTLPMSGVLAKYHYAFGNIQEALDVLNTQASYKDYIYFNENLKSIIYNELKLRDSSFHYARLAFTNLPGNANHYEQYVKNLVALKDSTALINSFRPSSFIKDYQFSKVFLSACLALDIRDELIVEELDLIKKYYSSNSEIKLMVEYLQHGIDNVNQSIELTKMADLKFDNNLLDQALKLYVEATNLNPSAYTNFENAGFCYFKLNKFKESIPFFQKVIEDLNPMTGKSEYLLGNAFFELGDNEKACNYLHKSSKLNFKPAFSEYARICK